MKLFFRLLTLVCLSVPLWAYGAREEVKVGIIYGEADTTTDGIPVDLLGTRLAIEELNRNGGILGRQVELIELNNSKAPLGSRKAAEKAVESGAVAIIGPTTSSHALLAGAVLQKAGIPMISAFATNPEVTLLGDYIFRVCFSDELQGKALADFAYHDLNAKTAVILTCSDEKFSIDLSEIFSREFVASGGAISWQGEYLSSFTNFQELLQETATHEPDIVFLPGYNRPSGFIIRQSGLLGEDITFLGPDSWSIRLFSFGKENVNGNYYSGHWSLETESNIPKEFFRQYRNRFEEADIVDFGLSHDAVFLLADAITRANSLDPILIRDALAATKNFQGVTGTITMTATGDAMKPVYFFKFEKGESVYIKTVTP